MTKTEQLFSALSEGWHTVPDLCERFAWKPHTLRGAISTLALPANGKIERRREDGITSYRLTVHEIAE